MNKFLLQISTSQQEMVTFQFDLREEAMAFHKSLFTILRDYDISNVRCYLTELVEPSDPDPSTLASGNPKN